MTTIWNNNNSYSAESRANEISEETGYSDPECMLCGRVMHNSFEQNDDEESIRNAIARHYEEYHADIEENFKFIDIEIKKQLAKTGREKPIGVMGGSNSQEGSMQPEAYTWFKSLPKNEQIELLSGQGYAQGPNSFKDIDNSQIGVGGEIDLLIENIYYSKFLGKDPQAISYGDKNEYPIDEDNYYDSDRQKIRTSMRDSYVDADGVTRQNESYANESAENWWNQLEVDSQTQVLIASQVDQRHAGLSWINLGHENQQKIIMEYGNDPEIITDNPIMNARDELSESGQVDNDPNWKSGRFRRGGSWADKKDAWDKSQGEALPPTDANEEEWLNNYSDNVDQSKKTNEDFDSYNLGNPKDDLEKPTSADQRIEDTQEVKGDYVVYDGEDYSVEDTTRNEEEPTEDRAGKLMRDQKATSNFWEDTQKSKVPQGQGHKWQKHGEIRVKANEAYREYFSDANGEDLNRISEIAEMSGNYANGPFEILTDSVTCSYCDAGEKIGVNGLEVNLGSNPEAFKKLMQEQGMPTGKQYEEYQTLIDKYVSSSSSEMEGQLQSAGWLGESLGDGDPDKQEFLKRLKNTPDMQGAQWLFGLSDDEGKDIPPTDDRPEDSHVTVDLSDKKTHNDLDDEFWKGIRESRTSSLFDPSEFSNEESDTEINPMGDSEKDEIFQYLFELQSSGVTNMFGAVPYAVEEFPQFDKKEVKAVVMEWMKNYSEIHDRMGIDFV